MFSYQKNFTNPTLPVDEAQFYALVRATQWNENIDKYRETGKASLKRKLPAFIFQATFDETTSKTGKIGRWRKQAANDSKAWSAAGPGKRSASSSKYGLSQGE